MSTLFHVFLISDPEGLVMPIAGATTHHVLQPRHSARHLPASIPQQPRQRYDIDTFQQLDSYVDCRTRSVSGGTHPRQQWAVCGTAGVTVFLVGCHRTESCAGQSGAVVCTSRRGCVNCVRNPYVHEYLCGRRTSCYCCIRRPVPRVIIQVKSYR